MQIPVPGLKSFDIQNLVLDMNGTIAVDGELAAGVAARLRRLQTDLRLVMITADTHGGASRIRDDLGMETIVLEPGEEGEQKLGLLRRLGANRSVAIGNGANDVLMLKDAAIGICVIGLEGACTEALLAADVVVTDVRDALDLLLTPRRLTATLRR